MTDSVHTFTAALRSQSAVVLPVGVEVVLEHMPADEGPVTVTLFSGHRDYGLDKPLPDGLRYEVLTTAADIDRAARLSAGVAGGLSGIAAFCGNAHVGPPALSVVFETSQGLTERPALWVATPDNEADGDYLTRFMPEQAFMEAVTAVIASEHASRLSRAIGHYNVALGYWNSGWITLALVHLNIAAEALGPALEKHHRKRLGVTYEEHAKRLGVDTSWTCPACGKVQSWDVVFKAWVRRKYIYADDNDTYQAVRKACDAFEHGTEVFPVIKAAADEHAGGAFEHIRNAILDILDLPNDTHVQLLSKAPLDASPFVHRVRGTLTGSVEDPSALGPAGQRYPVVTRESSIIEAIAANDGDVRLRRTERVKWAVAEGVVFQAESYDISAGLNEDADIQIETVMPPDGEGQVVSD